MLIFIRMKLYIHEFRFLKIEPRAKYQSDRDLKNCIETQIT